MTVQKMADQAALLSYRADEFIKNDEGAYVDEAADYLTIFLAAFNEANREAARKLGRPTFTKSITPTDRRYSLSKLDPPYGQIHRVEDPTYHTRVSFIFVAADVIEFRSDETVLITYNCMPDELVNLTDEPEFDEAQVDPMLYISLAVARVFQSERKMDTASPWEAKFYEKLSKVGHAGAGTVRRVLRRRFR